MRGKPKIAVFISGNGSNFQAIAEQVVTGALAVELSLLFSDQPEAYGLKRAEKFSVPTLQLSPGDFTNRQTYEEAILKKLQPLELDFIVLAGYLRIIGPTLREAYPQKIINIHPSLLPAYPGLNSIAKAFAAGEEETGVTIHYIDEGVDTGPIIAQEKVVISPKDSEASLMEKVQQVEHRLYPQVLQEIILKQKGSYHEKSVD